MYYVTYVVSSRLEAPTALWVAAAPPSCPSTKPRPKTALLLCPPAPASYHATLGPLLDPTVVAPSPTARLAPREITAPSPRPTTPRGSPGIEWSSACPHCPKTSSPMPPASSSPPASLNVVAPRQCPGSLEAYSNSKQFDAAAIPPHPQMLPSATREHFQSNSVTC